MFSLNLSRRTLAVASLVTSAALFTGCLDSTSPHEHEEPEIAAVAVSAATGGAASGTVTLTPAASGTLTLRANTANALTVRVLDMTGGDDSVIREHSDEFEIRLLQGTTTVATSTSGYPYAVSLTPAQAGAASYTLQVFALDHGHAEFTAALPVTVVAQ